MSDPIIRESDHYVVIEPGKEETILNISETLQWLEKWLKKLKKLPLDLQKEDSFHAAAQRLLDTACDLEINHGFRVQWFAVRLNHPEQ